MYLSLTAAEKLSYWQKKFDKLIADGKLNENQNIFLSNLKNTLTEDLFVLGSATQEQFNDEVVKQNAIELFGVDEAFAIIASVGMPHLELQRWYKDCVCSGRSDWCGSKSACGYGTCNGSSWGCGTILIRACDGLCRPTQIIL